MRLHELKPKHLRKKIKRVGRGGKRGTYSGRGSKGQRARAGHRIRPAERDIISKIPKWRGSKNRSLKQKNFVLKASDFENSFPEGTIDKKFLAAKGFIKNINQPVKILAGGTIKKSLRFKGLAVSKKAKIAIEKAGGAVE